MSDGLLRILLRPDDAPAVAGKVWVAYKSGGALALRRRKFDPVTKADLGWDIPAIGGFVGGANETVTAVRPKPGTLNTCYVATKSEPPRHVHNPNPAGHFTSGNGTHYVYRTTDGVNLTLLWSQAEAPNTFADCIMDLYVEGLSDNVWFILGTTTQRANWDNTHKGLYRAADGVNFSRVGIGCHVDDLLNAMTVIEDPNGDGDPSDRIILTVRMNTASPSPSIVSQSTDNGLTWSARATSVGATYDTVLAHIEAYPAYRGPMVRMVTMDDSSILTPSVLMAHHNAANGGGAFTLTGSVSGAPEATGGYSQDGLTGIFPHIDETATFGGKAVRTLDGGATLNIMGLWWGGVGTAMIYPKAGWSWQWQEDWIVIAPGLSQSHLHISWDKGATWSAFNMGTADIQGVAWLQGAPG